MFCATVKFNQERNELEAMLKVCRGLESRKEHMGRRPWSPGGANCRPPPSSLPTLPGTGTCRAVGLGSPLLHLHPGTLQFLSPKIRTLALSPVLTSCHLRLIGLPPVPVHGPFEDQKGEETPAENHLTVDWSFVV